jgi:CheY-like chemotaxis protein
MSVTSPQASDPATHGRTPPLPAPARPHVLVVDDAPSVRELLEDVLVPRGCEVTSVGSGRRALALMREHRPDLVIIDLLMPEMNGFQLRAAMLGDPELADIPTIVLSAWWHRPPETLEAIDVLPKPMNLDHLIAAVERALDGADAGPQRRRNVPSGARSPAVDS